MKSKTVKSRPIPMEALSTDLPSYYSRIRCQKLILFFVASAILTTGLNRTQANATPGTSQEFVEVDGKQATCKAALITTDETLKAAEGFFRPRATQGRMVQYPDLSLLETSQKIAFLNATHRVAEKIKGDLIEKLKPLANSEYDEDHLIERINPKLYSLSGSTFRKRDDTGGRFHGDPEEIHNRFRNLLFDTSIQPDYDWDWGTWREIAVDREWYWNDISFTQFMRFGNGRSYELIELTHYIDWQISRILRNYIPTIDTLKIIRSSGDLSNLDIMDRVFIDPILQKLRATIGEQKLVWKSEALDIIFNFILENTHTEKHFAQAGVHLWGFLHKNSIKRATFIKKYKELFDPTNDVKLYDGTKQEQFYDLMIRLVTKSENIHASYQTRYNGSIDTILEESQKNRDYPPIKAFRFIDYFFSKTGHTYSELQDKQQSMIQEFIRKDLSLLDDASLKNIIKGDPHCKLFNYIEERLVRDMELDISTFTPLSGIQCGVQVLK